MNPTGQMIEEAAKAGASEVLGMILEHQARTQDWGFEIQLKSKDQEIERLKGRLQETQQELWALQDRVGWMLTGEFPKVLF